MAITSAFKDAVAAGDVTKLRIMMKNSLLVDLTFREFDEMDSLARGVPGLYDAHDGRELNSDISAWDDDYMNAVMVKVVDNFSRERVEHLKKVVRHLRPAPAASKPLSAAGPEKSGGYGYREQKRRDEESGRLIKEDRAVMIGVGAAVGGLVGGTVAAIASASVFAGIAVGAVVVGGTVAVATNEKSR